MAEATSHVTTPQTTASTAATRRPSFRRSLVDSGLPSDSLEALEQKRKALDDSIHKYIASKEREYKQFEKELRYQARRLSGEHHDTAVPETSHALEASDQHAAISSSNHASHAGTSHHEQPVKRKSKKRHEDFPGVFTPEYIVAINHHNATETSPSQHASSSAQSPALDTIPSAIALRTKSDTDVVEPAIRPSRILLAQRTSSSGSSVDGRLVSALKSAATTSSPDLSKTKRKRVSLAVGDTIVAPSDSVPVALTVNSSSSHSRPKTPARERQSFLTTEHHESQATKEPHFTNTATREAVTAPDSEQTSAIVNEPTRVSSTTKSIIKPPDGDVGDMFDLEDSDIEPPELDEEPLDEDTRHEDNMMTRSDQINGRISQSQQTAHALDIEDDTGQPPPDEEPEVALSYTDRGSHCLKEPGFRRPSVSMDPVYAGRDYNRAEEGAEESGMYSSSFSRPMSKGSFTSGSLGESFMARNAEKLMDLRAQQRENERTSRPAHALPVR